MRQSVSSAAADCGESFLRADKTTDQCVVTKTGRPPATSDEGVVRDCVLVVSLVLTCPSLVAPSQSARRHARFHLLPTLWPGFSHARPNLFRLCPSWAYGPGGAASVVGWSGLNIVRIIFMPIRIICIRLV